MRTTMIWQTKQRGLFLTHSPQCITCTTIISFFFFVVLLIHLYDGKHKKKKKLLYLPLRTLSNELTKEVNIPII